MKEASVNTAELPEFSLSGTVRSVADECGDAPVLAQQLCEAVLRRHEEYGGRWPAVSPVRWPERSAMRRKCEDKITIPPLGQSPSPSDPP